MSEIVEIPYSQESLAENSIALFFNMIKAVNLPPSKPKSYLQLGIYKEAIKTE